MSGLNICFHRNLIKLSPKSSLLPLLTWNTNQTRILFSATLLIKIFLLTDFKTETCPVQEFGFGQAMYGKYIVFLLFPRNIQCSSQPNHQFCGEIKLLLQKFILSEALEGCWFSLLSNSF